MQTLPPGGAMLAINTTEDQIQPHLSPTVALAAVNTTTSVVISGDTHDVLAIAEHFAAHGVRTRQLTVSHAFHSAHMDPILQPFHTAINTLTYAPPTIPIISTRTGQPIQTFTAEHWVRQLRDTVRFADTAHTLHQHGVTTHLELGPDPALTPHITQGTAIPLQRATHDQHTHLINALAQAHNHGVTVDWNTIHTGRSIPLPTYPFQRQTYWLHPNPHTDITSTGLTPSQHPLLTALIDLDDEALLLSGRISVNSHAWLADHTVAGSTLLAGTAFLDMALHAADLADCDLVEELTLEAPLVLPADASLQIRLTVDAPDDDGQRTLTIKSRRHNAEDLPWTRHATGGLRPSAHLVPLPEMDNWPPADAEPVDVTDAYDRLAEHGYDYGPTFQALKAAWRNQDDLYAEVQLADAKQAVGHAIHPALLDAAMHIAVLAADDPGAVELPFSWADVRLHGIGATTLRVRISRTGSHIATLTGVDENGGPVITIGSLTTRPLNIPSSGPSSHSLFQMQWVAASEGTEQTGRHVIQSEVRDDGPVARDAHAETQRLLAELQNWLSAEHSGTDRLVIVTRNAIATGPVEDVTLTQAAIWGLVRSAQNEHPGQFVLIDIDGSESVPTALPAGEPQLAIRDGQVLVPRLAPAPEKSTSPVTLDTNGTVLVTGGTGTLGALLARHLVTTYGVQHLLLTSRQGPNAPGAPELARELTNLGATITITAADIADPQQLADLLATIPTQHPL
ncbi:polyketide synthase dehydratase domain-containing protein, partial [Nonomuraea sp. NPDC002799]